jgi:hypothetical protein
MPLDQECRRTLITAEPPRDQRPVHGVFLLARPIRRRPRGLPRRLTHLVAPV